MHLDPPVVIYHCQFITSCSLSLLFSCYKCEHSVHLQWLTNLVSVFFLLVLLDDLELCYRSVYAVACCLSSICHSWLAFTFLAHLYESTGRAIAYPRRRWCQRFKTSYFLNPLMNLLSPRLRRGYCYHLRSSVRPSVRYAISSQTTGQNPTKFGEWLAYTSGACKSTFIFGPAPRGPGEGSKGQILTSVGICDGMPSTA